MRERRYDQSARNILGCQQPSRFLNTLKACLIYFNEQVLLTIIFYFINIY